MSEDIRNSTTIPEFLDAVSAAYGTASPNISAASPLSDIWNTSVSVTADTPPNPNYTATGSISSRFPFNFIQVIEPPNTIEANLNIKVFESVPAAPNSKINWLNSRGIKATVFPVPISPAHPSGVIVKNGLTFIDSSGTSIPDESIVPAEAQSLIEAQP